MWNAARRRYEFSGPAAWHAGEQYRHPFRFSAPIWPFTYRGKCLNVDWYLEARAHLAPAVAAKAEIELLVAPRLGDR